MPTPNENKLEFDFSVQFYRTSTPVEISKDCNSLIVVNLSGVGGSVVTVNNFPLNPTLIAGANGESFTIGGNRLEVIKRKTLDIGFIGAPGLCAVIQKWYVNLNP